jgi:hypothetical protein
MFSKNSRESCGEIADVYLVIASEAKQSTLASFAPWIASLRSQ